MYSLRGTSTVRNDDTGRVVMKIRNVHALIAWNRNGGAHGGPKRPDYDETDEGLDDYEEQKNEQQERRVFVRACTLTSRSG